MSTCPSCAQAAEQPQTGWFHSGCVECEARSMAHSPAAAEAMNGNSADLLAAIERVWPGDVEAGKRRVWGWMKRLRVQKE